MNQRIKEFIDKANGYWEHGDFNMPKTVCFSEHDIELFAELIVKECIGVVEGGRFLHDQAPTALFAKECSNAIRKHFGVEE